MSVNSKNTPVNPKLWAKCQAEAKRKYRFHPSAYSNGYASKIYKERGGKWRSDSLKTWFNEDWKAINSSGTIVGECGSGNTKGKVKCLPASEARSLSKKDRSRLAKRKQSQDPKAGRSGAPVMVSSKLDSIDIRRDLRWDGAIDRIEQKYGLRLDSWRRLGPNQRGKPCGRGWVGLRGACKRGKKSDDNTEKIKASKVELADKIRAKKGMRDRNAPKIEVPIPSTRTKAKAVRTSTAPTINVKKLTEEDGSPSSFIATTENGKIELSVDGKHSPTWAQNDDGVTVSGGKSRQFGGRFDDFEAQASPLFSMKPDQFKAFIEKVRQDPAYTGVEEFRLGGTLNTHKSGHKANLEKLEELERSGLVSLTVREFDRERRAIVNFDDKGRIRKATASETDPTPLRAQVNRLRAEQSMNIGAEHGWTKPSESDLKEIRSMETARIKKIVEAEDKLYGRKNTRTVTEREYITKAEKWAKSQGFKNDGDGVNSFTARQAAKHDIAHPATHDLVGLDSAGIHSYFGGLKTGSGKKSLLGEEAIVNVAEHLSRGDTLESSVMSGVRVARMLSRDSTKQERDYVRSPKFLQDLNNLGEKALKADNFGSITKVIRESNWESGTVIRAGNV